MTTERMLDDVLLRQMSKTSVMGRDMFNRCMNIWNAHPIMVRKHGKAKFMNNSFVVLHSAGHADRSDCLGNDVSGPGDYFDVMHWRSTILRITREGVRSMPETYDSFTTRGRYREFNVHVQTFFAPKAWREENYGWSKVIYNDGPWLPFQDGVVLDWDMKPIAEDYWKYFLGDGAAATRIQEYCDSLGHRKMGQVFMRFAPKSAPRNGSYFRHKIEDALDLLSSPYSISTEGYSTGLWWRDLQTRKLVRPWSVADCHIRHIACSIGTVRFLEAEGISCELVKSDDHFKERPDLRAKWGDEKFEEIQQRIAKAGLPS